MSDCYYRNVNREWLQEIIIEVTPLNDISGGCVHTGIEMKLSNGEEVIFEFGKNYFRKQETQEVINGKKSEAIVSVKD